MAMRHIMSGALALTALFAAGTGLAKQNFSMDSRNQPVVTANSAHVPNCPNWSSSGLDSAALTDTNYGCAVNSNLAAMVADPLDLVRGKTDTSTDIGSNQRAIKEWHDAEPTGKKWMVTVRESVKGGGQ
jgi:pilus assembly protein CpaD